MAGIRSTGITQKIFQEKKCHHKCPFWSRTNILIWEFIVKSRVSIEFARPIQARYDCSHYYFVNSWEILRNLADFYRHSRSVKQFCPYRNSNFPNFANKYGHSYAAIPEIYGGNSSPAIFSEPYAISGHQMPLSNVCSRAISIVQWMKTDSEHQLEANFRDWRRRSNGERVLSWV